MAEYTSTQRDALQQALASGALTVEYDGKRTTYRSVDELKKALDIVNQSLSDQAGNPRTRRIGIYASKGLV